MYNKAILIGRMTADPERKQTTSGVFVTSFRIAVDRPYKDKTGEKQADFLTIVAWRKTAEFIKSYFAKGDPIGIEGSIQSRNYEDKNGNKRTTTEICAERAFFISGKANREMRENVSQANSPSTRAEFEETEDYGDDFPF